MARIVRTLERLNGTLKVQAIPCSARFDFTRFAEGDRAFISGKRPRFSRPLRAGARFELPNGFIKHDDLLGACPGGKFLTNTGRSYRVMHPDLETYISCMPRKVTPVYGAYASFIASLFDIHVAPSPSATEPSNLLEILDAGTGHGSMALSLARTIQAANPPFPNEDLDWKSLSSSKTGESQSEEPSEADENLSRAWKDWIEARRAVVHSVDASADTSRHAEKKVVAGFRRGLYLPHIDFHIGRVDDWLQQQQANRIQQRFLSYVFLDMPSCHLSMRAVTQAMKNEALIAVFVPSITQIGDCIQEIRSSALPLVMEKVLELGNGISNGRYWDVRLAHKKAHDPAETRSVADAAEVYDRAGVGLQEEGKADIVTERLDHGEDKSDKKQAGVSSGHIGESQPVMVCRPKVGEMVVGGGFVGVWRRQSTE